MTGAASLHGAMVPGNEIVHVDGDLALTVGIEESTVRVTHGLRRVDGTWYLVHRHADFPPADRRYR